MARICDNCRRPVLDSDTVCWHCGWKLPASDTSLNSEAVEIDIPTADVEEKSAEPALEPTALPLTIYYALLTLIIVIALIWLMNSLAQSPTIVTLASQSGDFVRLQDPQQQFEISVPAGWQWSFAEEIISDAYSPRYGSEESWLDQAGAPFSAFVDDEQPRLHAGDESVLLIITSSKTLNQLTGEQIVSSLAQETFEDLLIDSPRQVRNSAQDVVVTFNVHHDQPAMRCRQLWSPARAAAYLVSACTSPGDASIYQSEIDSTLDSFQVKDR